MNKPELRMRRSTITDVAKEAGVSIKTVSRVARQEPNVTEKTRTKVRAAMDKLSYRPTMAARSTVSSRSFLLGLIFDNPNPAYTLDLLRGALGAAKDNGYHMIVEPVDGESDSLAGDIRDLIVQSNLEGLIVPPPLCDRDDILAVLTEVGRPFSRIAPSMDLERGFSVEMDDEAAAFAMTEHLSNLGHKRIGFIKGRVGTATTRKRLEGYCAAMEAIGQDVPDDWTVQGDFSLKSGLECGERLLAMPKRPTAIFASNDEMAAGVLMAAHKAGLDVPQDLSVAGFDDSVTATAMWPQLTTIRQPVSDMAARAATCLINHQRGNEQGPGGGRVDLDFALIVRDSTGPVPEAD